MPDLTQDEYDIFLSHSTADKEWVERLALCLEQEEWEGRKLRAFISSRDFRPGEDITDAIQRGISKSRYLGVVMSPEAMESPYVELELKLFLDMILRKERKKDQLIPILRRECDPSKVPGELRRRCRINATGPDALRMTCRKLIAVIKGESLEFVLRHLILPSGETGTRLDSIPPLPPFGFFPRNNDEGHKVLELVREALTPGKNQRVAVWGPGGMGKTTLASTLARQMYDDLNSRVVWINAYDNSNFGLSTMLDIIAAQLDAGDLRAYSPEQKRVEIKKLVNPEHLLIVIDNFEAIKPDEQKECIAWLNEGVYSSVLIITREKVDDNSVINIHIGKLSQDDARKFLDDLFGEEDDKDDVEDDEDE